MTCTEFQAILNERPCNTTIGERGAMCLHLQSCEACCDTIVAKVNEGFRTDPVGSTMKLLSAPARIAAWSLCCRGRRA